MKILLSLVAQAVKVTPDQLDVPQSGLGSDNIEAALKIMFGLAGGIALVIVTIGGFRYVISQGNPQETTKAKNTILYALIGLVVTISAFSIVQFVIPRI